jgi:signal transduction histidine kinase
MVERHPVGDLLLLRGAHQRHQTAKADAARVTTVTDDGHFTIQVSDNGNGGASTQAAGGLAALTDRVAALDGTLEVTKPSTGGTTLTARLPLTP